jgi:hypothetical protein
MTAQDDLKQFLEKKGKVEAFGKAWQVVMGAAFTDCPELELSRAFSEGAIKEILPIVQKYEQEFTEEIELQEKIQDKNHALEFHWDDEVLFEIDSYAVVRSQNIEVIANTTGLGDRLPKVPGRKYTGDKQNWTWEFPLSALGLIRPIVDMVFDEKGDRL